MPFNALLDRLWRRLRAMYHHPWHLSIFLHAIVLLLICFLARPVFVVKPSILMVALKPSAPVQPQAHKASAQKKQVKKSRAKRSVKKKIKPASAKLKSRPSQSSQKKVIKKKKAAKPLNKAHKKLIKKPIKAKPNVGQDALAKALAHAKAQQQQARILEHQARLLAAIQAQWNVPFDLPDDVGCDLLIRLSASGEVLAVDVVKSSGIDALDRSAVVAVQRASPLPMPKDASLATAFKAIRLHVRPDML